MPNSDGRESMRDGIKSRQQLQSEFLQRDRRILFIGHRLQRENNSWIGAASSCRHSHPTRRWRVSQTLQWWVSTRNRFIDLIFLFLFISGFSVSVCGRQHIFKPVSVQAMWWVFFLWYLRFDGWPGGACGGTVKKIRIFLKLCGFSKAKQHPFALKLSNRRMR